jgi:oligopeptide transport system permease protein
VQYHALRVSNPLIHRRQAGRTLAVIGGSLVAIMLIASLGSLPYTLGREAGQSARRFEQTNPDLTMLPPFWAPHAADERAQVHAVVQAGASRPRPMMGTDRLGRSVAIRVLAGGGISLAVGFSAAAMAVIIGTLYGTIAGWAGGRVDSLLMRIVDILYGLPYILLVVLLAVAAGGLVDRANEVTPADSGMWNGLLRWIGSHREIVNIVTLLIAIGGVSWLTMARVIRGQVLSLKQQPFMEACRAIGVPLRRQFTRHLLPNLLGPIIVYATLTVPTAILSESFLSFLGIGVQEPLPSWGNLAASGLSELNTVRARWWLLVFPCAAIAITLLALNFMGEGLRERFDPKRAR